METDKDKPTAVPAPETVVPGKRARLPRKPWSAGLAAIALLAVGAGAGATGYGYTHRAPPTFDANLSTTPIGKLSEGSPVEVQGNVVEIYGNKYVVEDATGRALVETGRTGEGGSLMKQGEGITVQGRFDKGFLHATSLQRSDGKVEELRPLPPRPPMRDLPPAP
jgi:uncharacterized protein YdeI (BOF family)